MSLLCNGSSKCRPSTGVRFPIVLSVSVNKRNENEVNENEIEKRIVFIPSALSFSTTLNHYHQSIVSNVTYIKCSTTTSISFSIYLKNYLFVFDLNIILLFSQFGACTSNWQRNGIVRKRHIVDLVHFILLSCRIHSTLFGYSL